MSHHMIHAVGNKLHLGLRERAMLGVASLCVVCVLGVAVFGVLRTNKLLINNQRAAIDGVGSGLVTAIELPLAVGDTREMKRITENFLELIPDAEFIRIEDHEGRLLSMTEQSVGSFMRFDVRDKKHYDLVSLTVTAYAQGGDDLGLNDFGTVLDPSTNLGSSSEEETLGVITIGVTNDALQSAQRAQWRAMLIMLTVVMLATLPVCYLLVGGWTSRLQRLIDASRRITKGDYNHRIVDDQNDEIAKLAQAYEHMRDAIQKREFEEQRRQEELRIAHEQAKNANQAKSQFLAHMSHEIRTPINGVTGMLELMSMTSLTEKQRKQLRTAMHSADALLSLINDILDFSKIEAGQMEAESVATDLHDTFEGVAEMLACKASEKGVELICDIARSVPRFVQSDPVKLRQIAINLVSNAIKFTETGEVVIRVSTVSQNDNSWELRVSVTDTGIGISPEQRDRLFKSFSQIDASTTRKYGGTGLGLAISKGFVELMGGRIGINPERTNGSEFWFTFHAGECDKDYQPTPVFKGDLYGMRAMIVDDNLTNREIYNEALTNWGLRPSAYERGQDALEELRSAASDDPYQLIILDMQMPEMDGVMLAEAITTDDQIETPTMVMLTSMHHTADAGDLENLSLAACLQKPVRLSTLHDALAQYISGNTKQKPIQTPSDESFASSLKGASALVAEDNTVNQMVIGELLKAVGVHVKIVETGSLAVNEAYSAHYDLILMDCSMPEMDGFEATRWIREQESSCAEKTHTPIIALTANAIRGDRERCIDAGMDDYLTKPVNARKLYQTIARWLEHTGFEASEASGPDSRDQVPRVTETTPQGDTEIDYDAALERCAGSTEVLSLVLNEFTASTATIEHDLMQLYRSESLSDIALQAHSLKGAAANIGAEVLSERAHVLESAAKENEPENMDEMIQAIASTMDEVRADIERLQSDLQGVEE